LDQICPAPDSSTIVKVTPTNSVLGLPQGEKVELTYRVDEPGGSDRLTLAACDAESFVDSVVPSFISPSGDEGSTVKVVLNVPKSATIGTSDSIKVAATKPGKNEVTNNSVQVFEVIRGRNKAPVITATVNPLLLGPSDGRWVDVGVSGAVTQDQSQDKPGSGSYSVWDQYGEVRPTGSFAIKSDGSFSFTLRLRSARSDSDTDGRHYTITVGAKDLDGNTFSTQLALVFPREQDQ
jgi:hypothetical protein